MIRFVTTKKERCVTKNVTVRDDNYTIRDKRNDSSQKKRTRFVTINPDSR